MPMPMHSELENLAGLSRKLKVTVPQEQIQAEINKRLQEFAQRATIKGFRKGKVPPSVIKMQYGEAIKQEVIQEILSETLNEAFKSEKIFPAGSPSIELKNISDNAPFEYEASFEVFPDAKLKLDGISVEQLEVDVTDADVTKVIDQLRKQNVTWNDVDRAAKNGDMVVFDFEGFIDDQPFEGGSAKDFRLELGSKQMIPGFEDQLVGAQKDSEVTVNVTFPEDYHAAHLAGKPARFVVKVSKVMEGALPELNDAFAKDLGVDSGTVDDLKNEVKTNLLREVERRVRGKVKQQVIDKILETNQVDVPESAVDQEAHRLADQFKKQMQAQLGKKEFSGMPKEQFTDQARKNVLLGLLLSRWIEDNGLKVDSTKIRQRIDEIAAGYHQPHEIVNWYYSNKEALGEIEATVLEEQAIDKILELVTVVKKPSTYTDIMETK